MRLVSKTLELNLVESDDFLNIVTEGKIIFKWILKCVLLFFPRGGVNWTELVNRNKMLACSSDIDELTGSITRNCLIF